MAVRIVINGAEFEYPTEDDEAGWGTVASETMVAVSNALIPQVGGNFILTGELNFGNNFGVRIPYFKEATTHTVATTGTLRLSNETGAISWRKADGSGNASLEVNGANQLIFNGVPVGGGGSIPGEDGQVILADGNGNAKALSVGTPGFLLASQGAGFDPVYVDPTTLVVGNGIGVGTTLPSVATEGQYFFNTDDETLYHFVGGVWTNAVPAVLISGQITSGQIQDSAITSVKINNAAITAAKTALAAIDPTSGDLAINSVTANNIVAGTITALQIQAGTITANELAAGAVTTSKLAVLIGGGNQIGNSSFEALAPGGGNRPTGYTVFVNAAIATTYTRPAGRLTGTFGMGVQANANGASAMGIYSDTTLEAPYGGVLNGWAPNTQYVVSFYAKKVNGAAFTNMDLTWGGFPPASYVGVVNPTLTTTYQRYVFLVNWGAVVFGAGTIVPYALGGSVITGDELDFDDLQIEQGDVVTSWNPRTDELLPGTIVANMIAANTITANQIAANTITSGQIAANTITAGNIQAGTITGTQVAANTITATNINSNGLVIRDNSGNAILGVGTNLDSTFINPASGWINGNIGISGGVLSGIGAGNGTAVANSLITLGSNGVLSGGGGGSLSLSSLGAGAMAFINQITGANVTTYISGAAIGSAQIGVLAAGNIGANSIYAGSVQANAITTNNIVVGAVTSAQKGSTGTVNFSGSSVNNLASGTQTVFTLVTTGAPVVIGGTVNVLVTSTTSFTYGILTGNLLVDGTSVGAIASNIQNATQTAAGSWSIQMEFPISSYVTFLGAGNHSFQYNMSIQLHNLSGLVTASSLTMSLFASMYAQENKV